MASDLRRVDGLRIEPPALARKIRRSVRVSSTRHHFSVHLSDHGFWRWLRWIAFFVLLYLAGFLLRLAEARAGNPPGGPLIDVMTNSVGLLLAAVVMPVVLGRVVTASRTAMARFVVLMVATTLPFVITDVISSVREILSASWGAAWRNAGGWLGVVACGTVILTLLIPPGIDVVVTEVRSRRLRRPLDPLVVHTLVLADDMTRNRHRWREAAVARRWCRELENLAWRAMDAFDLSRRAHVGDVALRRRLRGEAKRAGLIYRSLIPLIVEARDAEAIDRVRNNLVHGIELMADDDMAAILSTAPVWEPSSPQLKAWFRRVVPGFVLISFGVIVPMLPVFAQHGQGAQSLRWGLILAGAAVVASASPDVSARVNEAVGRAFNAK
ncbi:hypothetical protein OG937_27010 [Streptomyces sp. NBC_00510]